MTAMEVGEVTPLAIELNIEFLIKEAERIGRLQAWESCKHMIESSNIMVCGDARGVPDVKGSLAFFKKALTLRADEMIKKTKGYEQPRMAAK